MHEQKTFESNICHICTYSHYYGNGLVEFCRWFSRVPRGALFHLQPFHDRTKDMLGIRFISDNNGKHIYRSFCSEGTDFLRTENSKPCFS
jgi:hypothetical protein